MVLSRANELLVGGVGHRLQLTGIHMTYFPPPTIPKSEVPWTGVYARLPMGTGVEQCQPTAMQLFAQP